LKKINIFILLVSFFLVSCGGSKVGKILRNEKILSNDEFLVKKKKPLILPPDSDKIPEPNSLSKSNTVEEGVFKEILKKPTKNNANTNKSSSIEQSILKRLPK
jgi:hypothetical protein|tara:strand:- start:106 stop:414 length:309 start_codon:yes stop_codon:yes gene_type:complete